MAYTAFIILFITAFVVYKVNSRPLPGRVCYEILEGIDDNNINTVEKRQVDCSTILQESPPDISPPGLKRRIPPKLSEEEKKQRQARAFEGLLHLATVVNHVDSFLMDKGKLILKSLGKMVASEEDNRFDM